MEIIILCLYVNDLCLSIAEFNLQRLIFCYSRCEVVNVVSLLWSPGIPGWC